MINQDVAEQICCATYKAGDLEIKAILHARYVGLAHQYSMILEQQGESTECALGSDIEQARRLFFDVVFGGVTACTLHDVVEDRMGTLF